MSELEGTETMKINPNQLIQFHWKNHLWIGGSPDADTKPIDEITFTGVSFRWFGIGFHINKRYREFLVAERKWISQMKERT